MLTVTGCLYSRAATWGSAGQRGSVAVVGPLRRAATRSVIRSVVRSDIRADGQGIRPMPTVARIRRCEAKIYDAEKPAVISAPRAYGANGAFEACDIPRRSIDPAKVDD